MTSALLFVALLIVVDLSYRRWMRRSLARGRRVTARPPRVIDLDDPDNSAPTATGSDAITTFVRPDGTRRPDRA